MLGSRVRAPEGVLEKTFQKNLKSLFLFYPHNPLVYRHIKPALDCKSWFDVIFHQNLFFQRTSHQQSRFTSEHSYLIKREILSINDIAHQFMVRHLHPWGGVHSKFGQRARDIKLNLIELYFCCFLICNKPKKITSLAQSAIPETKNIDLYTLCREKAICFVPIVCMKRDFFLIFA